MNAANYRRDVESKRFTITSGEKLRKTLKRLLDLKFIKKRQQGSHATYSRGNETVTIPLHDILKPGTAKSIEDKVNQILNQRDG